MAHDQLMDHPGKSLLAMLREPRRYAELSVNDRDMMLRMLRVAGLQASFAHLLKHRDLLGRLSKREQDLLHGAMVLAQGHARLLRLEINRVVRALHGTGIPLVLLKGGAFLLHDIPIARGRLVADLDIMVPRVNLPEVESLLERHGWQGVQLDRYDQHYYRQWMHEIPPMRHRERATELDVHHTILPRTSRLQPDPTALFESAIPLPNMPGILTLSPVDMVLHAVVHLFQDSDFDRGLRGVIDLDGLLRHFSEGRDDPQPIEAHNENEVFWSELVPRALTLNLERPLCYALACCVRLLKTPVPETVIKASIKAGAPHSMVQSVMHRLMDRVLIPGDPDGGDLLTLLAWWLLYVRSHWLRMPPRLLFRHLFKKSRKRWSPDVRNRRNI